MRLIRSFSRARTDQRGIVLVAALVLAILYFALMELLLIDSSRALNESQRFRARVVALSLAENAAELAALNLQTTVSANPRHQNAEGTMSATMHKSGGQFTIHGEGETQAPVRQKATVYVQGRINGAGSIRIDYTIHGW